MELQSIRTAYLNSSRPLFSPPCIPISLSNPFFAKNSQSALRLSVSRHSPRIPKLLSVSAARRSPKVSKRASAATPAEKEDRLPAELNITEIREPNSRVRLRVEVPPIVCQDCYRRVLNEFSKLAKVQ